MWTLVARIVIAVIAAVVSAVVMNQKSSSHARGSDVTLEDFEFPQFEEGTPIMYIFGDVYAEDWMVLGRGNFSVLEMEMNEDLANALS